MTAKPTISTISFPQPAEGGSTSRPVSRSGSLYANRTTWLGRQRMSLARAVGGKHVSVSPREQRRFSAQATHLTAQSLARR